MASNGIRRRDVDRGYAWFILLGCFLMYLLTVGSVKAYGVLYTEFLGFYGTGSGNTAWVGSISLLLMLGLGPFSNALCQRYSFRLITFVGGILLGVGYVSTAYVPKMELMNLTFGVITGLGYGLTFAPCSTIFNFYFEKRRALANGIVVSASGIGSLGFPFLYRFLIDQYNLRGALLITGGVVLNVCVAACFFSQPEIFVKTKKIVVKAVTRTRQMHHNVNGDHEHLTPIDQNQNQPEQKQTCCSKSQHFNLSLFKNPSFTIYLIGLTLCMNGYGANFTMLPAHIESLGYGKDKVALVVSIMGGSEIVARLFFGWLADQPFCNRRDIFFISMFIGGVYAFITPLFTNYPFLAAYGAILGFFPGSFFSIAAVLIIDAIGLKDFSSGFGILSLFLAISGFICQPTVGWIKDITGSWRVSFWFSGGMMILAGIVVAFEPIFRQKKTDEQKAHEQEMVRIDTVDGHVKEITSLVDSLLDESQFQQKMDLGDIDPKPARISQIYPSYDPDEEEEDLFNTSAPLVDKIDV